MCFAVSQPFLVLGFRDLESIYEAGVNKDILCVKSSSVCMSSGSARSAELCDLGRRDPGEGRIT